MNKLELKPGQWIIFKEPTRATDPYYVIGVCDIFKNNRCCILIDSCKQRVLYLSHSKMLRKKILSDDCKIEKISQEMAKELLRDKYDEILKISEEVIWGSMNKNELGYTINPLNRKEILSFTDLKNQQYFKNAQEENRNF